MVAYQMHFFRAKASQKRSISMQRIFVTYILYKGFCFFPLNFYFCDSTAVKSLINLSHSFYSSTPLLLSRTFKYFIRVSCVTEPTDAGRQLIYTKQRFCYKSKKKKIFSLSSKGIFISGFSTDDAKRGFP